MRDRIRHAKSYPFGIPRRSYLLRNGVAEPLAERDDIDRHTAGRTPVIASGSNRSPQRLIEKYGDTHAPIAVEHAWLADFDVVYAAHITRYGSIPATVHPVPGMRVSVSLTWLDDDQLEAMHATEGNYDYLHLERIALTTEAGAHHDAATAYIAKAGSLAVNGSLVGLKAVPAKDRPHIALTQRAAQGLVHGRTAPDIHFDDFVSGNVTDEALRRRHTEALRRSAVPFDWPHTRQD